MILKKILVININWIGDAVFSSPVFKAIKQAYPQSKISCLAVPRIKDILDCIPYIDEIIIYDEARRHRNILGKLNLIMNLRQKNFDSVFILHKSMTRAAMAFIAGIPIRVGYDTKKRGIFLTHKVPFPRYDIHRADYYLNVIEYMGIKIQDRHTRITPLAEAITSIEKKLKDTGINKDDKLVIINPGGNWDLKRWDKKNYALVIKKLVEFPQVKIIITGAEKDRPLAEEIKKISGIKSVIILAGNTTLAEMIALLSKATLVISADTGPLHIANSTGVGVVAIFGPTRPELTGPRGTGKATVLHKDIGCNRKACYHLKCKDNICMQAITVYDVINAAKPFLI